MPKPRHLRPLRRRANTCRRLCLKTRSGFERLIFRLAASGSIDDKADIACFAVFSRRKTARSRADDRAFRKSLEHICFMRILPPEKPSVDPGRHRPETCLCLSQADLPHVKRWISGSPHQFLPSWRIWNRPDIRVLKVSQESRLY